MKQMLSIVAIIGAVILISSCKATTQKTTNASPPSANTNTTTEKTIPSPSLGDPPTLSAKEKNALRLLGRPGELGGGQNLWDPVSGSWSPDASKQAACFEAVFRELELRKVFEEDIADNLREVVKTFSEKCPQPTIDMGVKKNPNIQKIQAILGKEKATQEDKWSGLEITWYKYAWLDFGAVKSGIVFVLRVHTEKMK